MAYSDFSLRKVLQDFALTTQDAAFLPKILLKEYTMPPVEQILGILAYIAS
jgi:hypothetical protein